MFQRLGKLVSRRWPFFLMGWCLLLIALWVAAPRWRDVAQDVQFALLPADAPSRKAEELYKEAFPLHHVTSNVVIVIEREPSSTDSPDREKKFIEEVLEPDLRQIAQEEGGIAAEARPEEESNPFAEPSPNAPSKESIIQRIKTPT